MAWAKVLVCFLLGVSPSLAHPPGTEEDIYLNAAQPLHRRVEQCQPAFKEPSFLKRTIERRQAEVERLRKERGLENPPALERRQQDKLDGFLKKNHQVNKPFNKNSKPAELFADDGMCVMSPLVSEGPLYVSGEQVRKDLTEHETGVPMSLEFQVVDAKTCQPLKDVAVDIWSCNTTGIYSGVWTYYKRPELDKGYDRSVINTTALRGIQFTNEEGIASFDTFFPGHYDGRAVHVHVMLHVGAKREPNGTITGGNVAHMGQLYFDQTLITEVEKRSPYTTNKQVLTLNDHDGLLKITKLSDDPFFRYVKLGDKLDDGLFSYIRLGIDTSSSWGINPAAYRDANGGHQNLTGPLGDGSSPPKIPPNPV